MKKCDYCKKEKRNISDMFSNGYCICPDCAKSFNKNIDELETMEQAREKKEKKI